jgi:hypothetical protein
VLIDSHCHIAGPEFTLADPLIAGQITLKVFLN